MTRYYREPEGTRSEAAPAGQAYYKKRKYSDQIAILPKRHSLTYPLLLKKPQGPVLHNNLCLRCLLTFNPKHLPRSHTALCLIPLRPFFSNKIRRILWINFKKVIFARI